jgi:WD40 repeat protein
MKPTVALALALLGDFSSRAPVADPSRFVLLRSAEFHSSSLSPAGNAFALYNGNSVQLYDVRQDRDPFALAGHNGNIHDSGWSRDGRIFATSGYDGFVRVWDVSTGRSLAAIAANTGYS